MVLRQQTETIRSFPNDETRVWQTQQTLVRLRKRGLIIYIHGDEHIALRWSAGELANKRLLCTAESLDRFGEMSNHQVS